MILWIDAQLSPSLATWITLTFGISAVALRDLGPPPSVILITCGNTSNAHLRQILQRALPTALKLLQSGEAVVEVR